MTKEELIKLSRENLRKSKQGSLCECYDEAYIKGYELSEKQIAELEKENAELKNKLEHRNCVDCSNHGINIKLLKAKELLKQWLQTSKASGCDNINIVTDTEQFLNENSAYERIQKAKYNYTD